MASPPLVRPRKAPRLGQRRLFDKRRGLKRKNYKRSRIGLLTNPSAIEGADTIRLANIWFGHAVSDGQLACRAAMTPWLTLQPDLQVVFDPAGDDSRGPVWIAGLRFVIQF